MSQSKDDISPNRFVSIAIGSGDYRIFCNDIKYNVDAAKCFHSKDPRMGDFSELFNALSDKSVGTRYSASNTFGARTDDRVLLHPNERFNVNRVFYIDEHSCRFIILEHLIEFLLATIRVVTNVSEKCHSVPELIPLVNEIGKRSVRNVLYHLKSSCRSTIVMSEDMGGKMTRNITSHSIGKDTQPDTKVCLTTNNDTAPESQINIESMSMDSCGSFILCDKENTLDTSLPINDTRKRKRISTMTASLSDEPVSECLRKTDNTKSKKARIDNNEFNLITKTTMHYFENKNDLKKRLVSNLSETSARQSNTTSNGGMRIASNISRRNPGDSPRYMTSDAPLMIRHQNQVFCCPIPDLIFTIIHSVCIYDSVCNQPLPADCFFSNIIDPFTLYIYPFFAVTETIPYYIPFTKPHKIECKNIDLCCQHSKENESLGNAAILRGDSFSVSHLDQDFEFEEYDDNSNPLVNPDFNICKDVVNFFRLCLANGERMAYTAFEMWLIRILFYPSCDKLAAYPILSGPHGIGKDTFMNFIRKFVLGEDVTAMVMSMDMITQRFNDLLENKVLIVLNEESLNGKDERVTNIFKTLCADMSQCIETKHKKMRSNVKVHAHFCCITNDPDPSRSSGDTDRRDFVVRSKATPMSPEFYAKFRAVVANPKTAPIVAAHYVGFLLKVLTSQFSCIDCGLKPDVSTVAVGSRVKQQRRKITKDDCDFDDASNEALKLSSSKEDDSFVIEDDVSDQEDPTPCPIEPFHNYLHCVISNESKIGLMKSHFNFDMLKSKVVTKLISSRIIGKITPSHFFLFLYVIEGIKDSERISQYFKLIRNDIVNTLTSDPDFTRSENLHTLISESHAAPYHNTDKVCKKITEGKRPSATLSSPQITTLRHRYSSNNSETDDSNSELYSSSSSSSSITFSPISRNQFRDSSHQISTSIHSQRVELMNCFSSFKKLISFTNSSKPTSITNNFGNCSSSHNSNFKYPQKHNLINDRDVQMADSPKSNISTTNGKPKFSNLRTSQQRLFAKFGHSHKSLSDARCSSGGDSRKYYSSDSLSSTDSPLRQNINLHDEEDTLDGFGYQKTQLPVIRRNTVFKSHHEQSQTSRSNIDWADLVILIKEIHVLKTKLSRPSNIDDVFEDLLSSNSTTESVNIKSTKSPKIDVPLKSPFITHHRTKPTQGRNSGRSKTSQNSNQTLSLNKSSGEWTSSVPPSPLNLSQNVYSSDANLSITSPRSLSNTPPHAFSSSSYSRLGSLCATNSQDSNSSISFTKSSGNSLSVLDDLKTWLYDALTKQYGKGPLDLLSQHIAYVSKLVDDVQETIKEVDSIVNNPFKKPFADISKQFMNHSQSTSRGNTLYTTDKSVRISKRNFSEESNDDYSSHTDTEFTRMRYKRMIEKRSRMTFDNSDSEDESD